MPLKSDHKWTLHTRAKMVKRRWKLISSERRNPVHSSRSLSLLAPYNPIPEPGFCYFARCHVFATSFLFVECAQRLHVLQEGHVRVVDTLPLGRRRCGCRLCFPNRTEGRRLRGRGLRLWLQLCNSCLSLHAHRRRNLFQWTTTLQGEANDWRANNT